MAEHRQDLGRTVFAVLFIAGLIGASGWILRPFLGPILWAIMIVVATWPLLLRLQARLFGRRSLAVGAITIVLLLVLVLPLTLVTGTLVTNAGTLVRWAGSLGGFHIPPPPEWFGRIPLAGESLTSLWLQFGALSNTELLDRAAPYARDFVAWLLPHMGSLGFVVVQFLMTVAIAAIFYSQGEAAGQFVLRFAARLGGAQGEAAMRLAAQAIRGVALGVVGTALIQSVLAGLGLVIAGVPFAGLLAATAFVLTVAQLGVVFVLAPAVIWMYYTGATGMATFLLVWTLVVGTADNFIRPLLIKRGANLSLMLIFAGVVGGLLTLGVIGIFVGPVVLAVSWTLLSAWVDAGVPSGQQQQPGAGQRE